ncbi:MULTISPECIES: tetratricopeptide repeat protein [unclassified Moraxella]|uniref:tetratricopeptide repeat protein n=1 Tax=unclassified Moraxella TaxID=2685852 RepID=UPI003AF69481
MHKHLLAIRLAMVISLSFAIIQPGFAKTKISTNDTVVQQVAIQGINVRFENNPTLDKQAQIALPQAKELMMAKQFDKALATVQPIIDSYQQKYANSKAPVYSSRTVEQAKVITQLAIDKKQKEIIILHDEWVTALYLKGFILVEKNQPSQALTAYHQALELSPFNSQVASEIGHLFQIQRDWQSAGDIFEMASQFSEFSPAGNKDFEYTRALRGMAFSATEQGDYEKAKKLYQQCLEINPKDNVARQELQYVQAKSKK